MSHEFRSPFAVFFGILLSRAEKMDVPRVKASSSFANVSCAIDCACSCRTGVSCGWESPLLWIVDSPPLWIVDLPPLWIVDLPPLWIVDVAGVALLELYLLETEVSVPTLARETLFGTSRLFVEGGKGGAGRHDPREIDEFSELVISLPWVVREDASVIPVVAFPFAGGHHPCEIDEFSELGKSITWVLREDESAIPLLIVAAEVVTLPLLAWDGLAELIILLP